MVSLFRIFLRLTTSNIRNVYVEDMIYDHKFAPEDVLGLDHVDKSGKTRTGAGEKAIVIRSTLR